MYHDRIVVVPACSPITVLNIHFKLRQIAFMCNAIVIHLHPNRITRWVVLHEMAHWLDPGSQTAVTHGPQFRAAHVALVRAAFGQDPPFGEDSAADVLAAEYLAAGVPFSPGGEMTP